MSGQASAACRSPGGHGSPTRRSTRAAYASASAPAADEEFTPVELFLAAIAGCGAIDVDFITAKRAEPATFEVSVTGDKVRDEDGNRLEDLQRHLPRRLPRRRRRRGRPRGAADAVRAVARPAVHRQPDRRARHARRDRGAMTDFSGFRGGTARMRLRPYALETYDAVADLHGRDDVTRYLPWSTRDADASRAALRTAPGHAPGPGRRLDQPGRVRPRLGTAGRGVRADHAQRRAPGRELGYVVHPDFQGAGPGRRGRPARCWRSPSTCSACTGWSPASTSAQHGLRRGAPRARDAAGGPAGEERAGSRASGATRPTTRCSRRSGRRAPAR